MMALAAWVGALAVVCGAYGAHALRGHVEESAIASWTTASHYHLIHALALLALALYARTTSHDVRLPAMLFAAGILLFSGSIYLLVLTPWRWLGPVTPLGGLLLIAGWLSLLLSPRS